MASYAMNPVTVATDPGQKCQAGTTPSSSRMRNLQAPRNDMDPLWLLSRRQNTAPMTTPTIQARVSLLKSLDRSRTLTTAALVKHVANCAHRHLR